MTEQLVDTWKVHRRQDMGGGVFREPGELIPEAHLFYTPEHADRVSALERVRVPAAELVAAIQRYCPDRAQAVVDAVMREQPAGPGITDDMVTIRSTDNPEAVYAPVAGPKPKEFVMVERTEGDQNYLREPGDMDPSALNEALTGTRPEDIARHNPDAAYEQPGESAVVVADPEYSFSDPIGSTPSGAVGAGSNEIPADEPVDPADLPEGAGFVPPSTEVPIATDPQADPASPAGVVPHDVVDAEVVHPEATPADEGAQTEQWPGENEPPSA